MIKKELDSLGLAGVIVNVVVLSIESLVAVFLIIAGLVIIVDFTIGLLYLLLGLALSTISIIALVFNAKVLAGELIHKKVASVLGFICLSVLGSVLLTISKDEVASSENVTEHSLADTLTKLKELFDLKAISEVEFTELKRKLIN